MLGTPSPLCERRRAGIRQAARPFDLKPTDAGGYRERHLQEIIDQCPEVLAVREFLPEVRALVSLGREIPVELGGGKTGYIDNLLVTDTGHLVVVETKLWRNPEALREVVAQVLHYGMALMALSIPLLEACVRRGDPKSPNRLSADESISQRLGSRAGLAGTAVPLDGLLDRQTRSGEMLFLVVGDGIHQSVERFASWLGSFKALPFQFGLMELRFYSTPSEGTLVVPRTLLRTKEVARHVVSIRLSEEAASQVQVDLEDTVVAENGSSTTSITPLRPPDPSMSKETLLEKARAEASPEGYRFLAEFLERLGQEGFDFRGAPTELAVGLRESSTDRFLTFFNLQGTALYAAQSGFVFDAVGPEALRCHRRALNTMGGFYTAEAVDHFLRGSGKGCRMPKYDTLTGKSQQLIDEFVRFRDEVLRGPGRTAGDGAGAGDAPVAEAQADERSRPADTGA